MPCFMAPEKWTEEKDLNAGLLISFAVQTIVFLLAQRDQQFKFSSL